MSEVSIDNDAQTTQNGDGQEVQFEPVCIEVPRIYDSCGAKDCLRDLTVFFTAEDQDLVETAASVRVTKASVLTANISVDSVAFNRGYYAVDVVFYIAVGAEVYTGRGTLPATVTGLATASKRVVLYGSDEKLALPYDGREEGEKLCYSGVGYSACGIISNISDLLKWTDGIFYDKILSDESINIMRTATDDGYSCGMYVSGDRLTASGRCGAYSSMLSYTTDKSEIFVSLSNYNYSDPSHLRGLFRKYLSKYSAK